MVSGCSDPEALKKEDDHGKKLRDWTAEYVAVSFAFLLAQTSLDA